MYELINELISHREKANVVPKASIRGNRTSFRQSLRNLAAIENAKVPAERRVSQKAVFAVAERSLQKTAGLEKKTRQFIAYKEVSSFISLACSGELSTESQVSYRDLLPLGHPLSSRYSAMTASALRHARSRWIAADPRVDDEAREIVAAAYFYDRSSAEYSHAIASLQVLVAGGVPREIYLSALTAAFSFGSGNSSAARSARANLQWRDRLGRWIEMGRGIGFKINIDGNNVPINGKFIGVDGKRGLVQVKGDPNLPDGIYPVESSNAQEYKALLPDSVAGKLKGKLSSIFDSRAQIFSKEDMIKMRMDAPAGWKKNKDGSFGSDDDYIVEEVDGKLTLFRKDKNGDKGAQVGEPVDDWAQIQDLANADEEDYDKFKRIMSAPSNADVLPGSEKDPYDNLNPSAKAVLEEQAAKKAADKAFFEEKKKKHNEDVDKFEAMFEQGKDIEGRDIPEGWELGISKYSTDGVLDIRTFQKLVPSADGKNQVQVIAEIDAEGKINFGHRANWFNKNENGTGGYDTWEEVEARIPDVVEWVGDAKSLQHDPADPWFKETIPVPRAGDDESAGIFDLPDSESSLEFPTLFNPDKPLEEADDWVGVDPERLAKLAEDIKALEEKWAEIDKKNALKYKIKKKKGPFKNLKKLEELEGIQMLKVKGADGVEIESPVAEFSDRPMVLVNVNGVRIPFYISTGMGGKKEVAVGEWYPIFGIKDGWFNKGDQDDINDFYGSPELKEVAQWLNSNIGDIRAENIPQIIEADEEEFAEQQLNRDVSPVGYGSNPFLNIRDAVARISGDEERIAEVEEMKAIKKADALEKVKTIQAKIDAEEPGEPTPEAPKVEEVTDVVSKLTPPAGAWKLQSPEKFEPEGRVDDEMSPDFSDDPEVLANKFSEDALVDAFIQAIVGKKDYALDLLEDSSEDDEDVEVDEDGEPVAKKEKKGKPGPKKKKPEQKPVGYGNGALDFSQGEEWVPAEALYLALKNQGYDVDLLLAQLYDTGLGESKNQDLLKSLRKEETVQAETPLLDAIDPEDAEAIARANVEVASVDASSAVVAQVLELNRNGEPNPAIVQLAAKIAKAKGAAVNDMDSGLSDDLQALLNEYIVGALDPDAAPEDKQAFQALWGMIMSLDEGVSDGIEETKLANGVFDALTKYYGDAEWSDVKEFWDKNGGINALIRSKKALVDGKESIDSDTSFAGAYYRLMAESARYNQETLYRGIQVPLDSPLLARLKAGGLLTFDARSFSTDRNVAAIQFGGAMNAVGDKAAVIFNIKPLKSKASDLTSVSPFNEREHKVIGNFKVVGVKQTKSPQGKITYEVEIEMVSKRDAVLDGLDTSYNDLLMKENASPEMPEGYHKIDPSPYESRAEQDFPEDFEDKPDAVARNYDRDVLAESFRQAIENGSGEVILEWDNEKEVTVAVELIRDALQIQGVDTNALLDDIANADPEAQVSDEEAEPAEQSVDNPVNAIVEDVSQEYDMEGWKKVGPQLGSNEGGFYEDAEGNRFYVKKPKSDLHAENEVLAAALYKLLGVDAAEIGIGSGEDGVKMTFSPDIIGSKQDLQEKLNDPAYLAKLQEGFAVDAWLGNWDVAGLGFDNVMSDGSGNPVRVDPGGALLFRAMGKPKGSLFGNEVNELDTLRDPNMNPQSAAVFGSMTDEQQKESARKLLAISNDDIDSMVDGIVTDPEAGQEIKDKLKARRQFILERYDLLSEDISVVVDNADISEEQDADPEAVSTPEGKSAEVDSRLDNARSWAEEYALDENMLASARKKFQAVADQIEKVLVDWRNGEISDEELPGVIGELRDLADFGKIGDDIALLNNIDDIDQQLMDLQEYIEEENKKNAPEPAVGEAPVEAPEPVATESVTNPYKDKNGTPIEPGAKIRYEKKGVVLEGVFSRYDKNTGYVWVKMPDGKKPVVFSTKYLTVIDGDGGGGEGPKAPEAPESPEPEAPETPTPDITPDEDIEPELDTPQEDIGQFEPTAQLTKDGKVRVSFVVDGNRPFNPKGDGPAGYEEVLPYVVDSKLDVDGVDEVTVEIPLDKMDDFAKDYKSVFNEKLIPEEFYGDIYTDYQEPKKEDSAKSEPEPKVKTKEELPEFSPEGWTRSVTPDQEILGIKVDNSKRIIFDKKQKNGSSLRIAVNKDTLEDPRLREGLEDLFTAMDDLHQRYPIDGLVIGINNPDPDNPEVMGTTASFEDEPGQPPVITINKELLTKKQRISVEHTAAHEYGHALDPRTKEEAEKGLEEFKALMTPTFNKFPMTEYGLTSGREAFAEAFAAFYVRKYGKPFDPNAPKTSYTQSQKVFQTDKLWENTIKHFNIEELAVEFERSPFKVEDTFDAENPATLEEGKPKLNLYAQNIKDILKKQGTEISDEKAIEIRDAIEENDLIEKWSSATDEDIASAILDVVGPGIVDLVDEDIDAGDADEETPAAAKPSPSTPFPDEPILNEAANELVKLFSYGMPEGGKILAVHEKDGMIAATPDGETVYIIDAKKKTNYTPEAKPDFFEPGGNGVEVFQWRQPTKEENDALLEKIAQNKSEPFGTESEPIEDVDATEELEVPDGFTAIADSTGNQIFAGVKVADKDGVIGTVLKVNKDNYAFVDFGNGVVKWRSGKTLKSTNTLDENFKGPTAKKSTTKATGAGAEPVIVDSPANWSLSNFEEVPALPDAIAKALDTSDEKAAMRGASAAVDADSIEDLDVRVMHVRNAEGADGIQLKFKLTNWAGKKRIAEIASMTEQERADAGIEVGKLRIPRITIGKDGVGDLSASEAAYESPAGRTYKITTKDGIVITIHRANQDSSDTFTKGYGGVPARAFHNTVQIQAPADATDDQIANALALAGVSQVRPATPADAKVLIENRLMSIFDAKTDANTNPKGEARVESLQKVKDKWGLTVDDVIVTTGPSGRIEYRLSEEGAKKIWEATGKPEALSHGLRHPGVLDYNMSNEQKVKAMTDWLVGFIDNPQGGLLSTTTRWTEGIGISGQSSTADIGTGGADYVFTRPTKSADRKRYGTTDWIPTLYFDPLKAYQRLDFYANYTDAFGKRSKNKDVISAAQVGAYEVMFKQRLSWDDLDVMVVSADMHQGVIEGLKARGIDSIGGRPIEEVIITGTGVSKS